MTNIVLSIVGERVQIFILPSITRQRKVNVAKDSLMAYQDFPNFVGVLPQFSSFCLGSDWVMATIIV